MCRCFDKLNVFWRKSNCPQKIKLDVYGAAIRSKLVYGLEAVHLSQSVLNKFDVFQLKGLRKILGLTTTYINRTNTSKKVFEDANAIKNPNNVQGKNIKAFSTYVSQKQEALVKHTVRASADDPLRQCTFDPDVAVPIADDNRRTGRPRCKWAYSVLEKLHIQHGRGNKQHFKRNLYESCVELEYLICNRII